MLIAAADRKDKKLRTVTVAFHFTSFYSRAIEFGLWSLIALKLIFLFLHKFKEVGCFSNFPRHGIKSRRNRVELAVDMTLTINV